MTLALPRSIFRLSVRVRIVLLALIPVVGFLANGIAYTVGETEVAQAFDSVKHAGALNESSQEFKAAVTAMRINARDFSAQPTRPAVAAFDASYALAVRSLATIQAAVAAEDKQYIQSLNTRLADVMANFEKRAAAFVDQA